MSRQRRQEERRLRQRRRRQGRPSGYAPVPGPVQFPGIMGIFQRYTRLFYLGGVILMVASLGAVFLGSRDSTRTRDDTPTPTASAEATATPSATPTPEQIQRRYSAPPQTVIDPSREYEALIHTDRGDVRVQLLPQAAASYVNNFVFLAQNRFYEGLTFHRVEPNFVVQAGDPGGRGTGGPGYSLTEEKNDLPFDAGVLSMAKAGSTVNGSQFFITLSSQPLLKPDFTVFGKVTEGLDLLGKFEARDPRNANAPAGVTITSIEIIAKGAGQAPAAPPTPTPAP